MTNGSLLQKFQDFFKELLNFKWIDDGFTLPLLALVALILIILFVLIRIVSRRRTIKVKLITPKLPEKASLIPKETLNGLIALYNSTTGALQVLVSLQDRKTIGSQMFEQLTVGYKAQLSKIEQKFLDEIESAERARLQKVYDKSLKPATTTDATSTAFPYLDLIPSVGETLVSSSRPSGVPPSTSPSSSPSAPPSGSPSAPSDGLPFASPPAPPPTPSHGSGGPPKGPPKGPPPPAPPSERKRKKA